MSDEHAFLDTVAGTYTPGATQKASIRRLIVRTFAPGLMQHTRALPIGFAGGSEAQVAERYRMEREYPGFWGSLFSRCEATP
jgi:hypothetical protein